MRIFINTFGSHGDVRPFIILAKKLKTQGHTVMICTCSRFKREIVNSGIDYGHMNTQEGNALNPSLVTLHQVSKSFADGKDSHLVFNALNFTLQHGDSVALTGISGSGKSTLLNIIAGFEPLSQGELLLEGKKTATWQDKQWSQFRYQKLGVIFQQFNLLTPLNVKQNIAFSLHLNQQPWNAWCDYLVSKLGIDNLLKRHVSALSGGQQQRVAIARALAHQPKLLLADEPTGNLDEQSSLEVIKLLADITREGDTAVLLVTHSSASAAFMQTQYHLQNGYLTKASSQEATI